MLTREAILQLNDKPSKAVEVPEWNTTVFVRQFSGKERVEFERLVTKPDVTEAETLAAIAALALINEQGQRLFSMDDVEALQEMNFKALARIAKAAWEFNTLTPEAIAEAGNG